MVLVADSAALAENHQNSAEFYASLPRGEKSLLCCVCHEHNTTFRYEVIYKSGPTLGHKQQPVNSEKILLHFYFCLCGLLTLFGEWEVLPKIMYV